jgi:hypothetical protein
MLENAARTHEYSWLLSTLGAYSWWILSIRVLPLSTLARISHDWVLRMSTRRPFLTNLLVFLKLLIYFLFDISTTRTTKKILMLTKFSAFVALSILSISVGKNFQKVLVYLKIVPKTCKSYKTAKDVFIFIYFHCHNCRWDWNEYHIRNLWKNLHRSESFFQKKIPDEKLTCRGPQTKFR